MLFLINPRPEATRISFDTIDSFCWFPSSCKYKMYKLTSSALRFRKTPKAVNIRVTLSCGYIGLLGADVESHILSFCSATWS